MADNTVEIKFIANTDGFDNVTQSVAQSLRILREQTEGLSSQMSAAASVATGNFGSALDTIKAQTTGLHAGMAAATVDLRGMSSAAASAHVPLSTLTQEARALVDELSGGRLHQAVGTAVRTLASIGSINPIWAAAAVGIGGVGLGLYEVAKQAVAAERALVAVQYAAAFSGQNVASDKMQEQIQKTQELASVTSTEAGEIVSAFTHMSNGSAEMTDLLITHLDTFSKEMDEKPLEAAKKLASMFNDAASPAMQKFIENLRGVSPALTEEYQAALKSGDAHRTQVAAINVLLPVLERANGILLQNKTSTAQFNMELEGLGTVASGAEPQLTNLGSAAERASQEVNDLATAGKRAFAEFAAGQSSMDTIIQAATDAGNKVNTLRRQMDEANTQRNQIVAGIAAIDKSADSALGKKRSQLVEDLAAADERVRRLNDQMAGGDIVSKTETAVAQINATWTGSTIARLHAEQELWKNVAATANIGAKAQEEATRRAAAIEGELRRESQRAALAGDDNAIAAAKRGSEEKIAAATKYWQDVKKQSGEGTTEEISAYRKVIEARNEASNAGDASAKKDLSVRRDAVANGLEAEMQAIRQQADMRQISRQQELAQLLDFQRRKDAIQNKGTSSNELSQLLAVEEGRLAILQTGSAKEAQITREVTDKIAAEYKEKYDQIAQEAGSDLNQIIWGHETLQQAALKFAEQTTGNFLTESAKRLANSIATNQAEIQANLAKNSLVVSSDTTGAAASSAVQGTAMAASIKGSAGEAYAGVFGFLSPVMGPLAAVPAAAAEGLVMAKQAFIPAFDVGTDMVMSSGLAMIHRGEKIVPATSNGPYTGGSGGGNEVHFHINAIDARGVAAFLQANGQQIAATVAGQQNNNPSLRGKW